MQRLLAATAITLALGLPAQAHHRHQHHHHHYRHLVRRTAFEGWTWPFGVANEALAHFGSRVGDRIRLYFSRVTSAAEAAGVPPAIAHAVVRIESNYNPNSRSSSGAIGIMQVLRSTARAMGEDPYTIDGNLRAGMKYLRLALNSSTNLCAAISGYNHGILNHPYCSAYGRQVLAIMHRGG